jgi:ADP-ribosyl-[dinitrogen reductase] hydrolase
MTTHATLVGQAIGDALGMPFETLGDKVHPDLATWAGEYRPGTWHKLPAGHWTDDTEMAECLATSIIENRGFNGEDVARRYLAWAQATPHGMGGTTRAAMDKLASGASWMESGIPFDDPDRVGSAPPMRAAPIGAFYLNESAIADVCAQDAYITHRHPEAIAASFAVAFTVRLALQGVESRAILPFVLSALSRTRPIGWTTRVEDSLTNARTALSLGHASPELFTNECVGRRGNAWQITSTAIYCALWADNFRDGVIAAVKLGGDADTRGAIAGAILGARFGLEGIPDEYKTGLLRFDDLAKLDLELRGPT